MQWRSARIARVAAILCSTVLVASCTQDPIGNGPRIATMEIVAGNNQTAPIGGLAPQPLTVQVADQRGDPIRDQVIEWTVTSGNGLVSPRFDTTDADGYASATYRLGGTIGVQTVSATLPGLSPVTFAVNATSAPASKLVAVSGDAQSGRVGGLLLADLVVRVTDAFDNPKPGANVSFTVLTGGGAVSAATVTSDATGLAKIKWTLGTQVGSQSLIAGSGAIVPITFTATAAADVPSTVSRISGNNQATSANGALADSLVVRVLDQYGNGVSGVTVDWVVSQGGGSASPASSVTNGTGRGATKWTLGSSGGPATITAVARTATDSVVAVFTGAVFITFETIAAGGRSSCGIDDGGVLYCWGFNGDGQLGLGAGPIGSGPVFTFPQAVATSTAQTFMSMNGGQYHHCAVTFSHVGYCWGDNNNGQLGINAPVRSSPQPTLIFTGIPFASVSSGRSHSCGLTIGGRAWCWGSNERGQLGGNVDIDTTLNTVKLVPTLAPAQVGSQIDGKFFAVYDFKTVVAGGVHSCGIQPGGAVRCWGLGREGQLGNGTNSVDEYDPRLVSTGVAMDSITAGFKHSCSLSQAGAAFCWGDNIDGQLGNGSNIGANTPSSVSGGLVFTQLAAGYGHTCGIAAGGQAYCWGRNDRGQLGIGSNTPSNAPAAVAGGLTFRTISAGDLSTCGVTTSNVAYCWGDNEYGALGDGTQVHRSVPAKVRFQQ
ncbi:MAG: Ig-like domain-containing protein [Gemmatimonadales bacterium]